MLFGEYKIGVGDDCQQEVWMKHPSGFYKNLTKSENEVLRLLYSEQEVKNDVYVRVH